MSKENNILGFVIVALIVYYFADSTGNFNLGGIIKYSALAISLIFLILIISGSGKYLYQLSKKKIQDREKEVHKKYVNSKQEEVPKDDKN